MAENREKLQGLEGEERRAKQQEINKEMNDAAVKASASSSSPSRSLGSSRSLISSAATGLHRPRGRQETEPDRFPEDRYPNDRSGVDGGDAWDLSQDQSPEERAAGMKKMAELNKETLGKAEKKLNDEQQKTWKELSVPRSR